MDKIEKEIEQLTSLRLFLKKQLNSTYGNNFKSIIDKRNIVREQLIRLYKIKSRKYKIEHIINKI